MTRGGAVLLFLLLSACPETPVEKAPPPPAGPGVTFTSPRSGQLDVPTRAPVIVHFSQALSATPTGSCDTFCVQGPRGVVQGEATLVRPDTISFAVSGAFEEGTTYSVTVSSALLPGATNLPAGALFSFTTRQLRPKPGALPTVLAFNDAPPTAPVLPFLDVSTLRLVFSEPIDPDTVNATTVKLLSGGSPVPVSLSCGGSQVVVDPVTDLTAGQPYTLSLSGVKDLGGEVLADFSLALTPQRAAPTDGPLFHQSLEIAPAWTPGTTNTSSLSGAPQNASLAASPLIGAATLGLQAGVLEADLGDPAAFGGPIPMVLRKGQQLDLTPLAIRLGGQVESGYQTGALHFTVLNDAVGFLTRNPLRPPEQLPDDNAPVFVDLTMDTVLTAEDAQGNAMATQTLMGLRLLGLSSVDGNQLAVEQVGALDFGTLGINVAPTTLALKLRTGASPHPVTPAVPTLTSTFPTAGATDAAPDTRILLVFSGPVSASVATLALTENATTAVNVSAHVDGSTLVVTPSRRLVEGAQLKLSWSNLTTPSGAGIANGSVSFKTATIAFTAMPPLIASVSVGAPCALVGATASAPGSCVSGDETYAPFTLAANRDLRVTFTQPMRAQGMVLGASCGQGSIRVEQLSANGACVAAVPGTLFKSERAFRFVPTAPLAAGTRYRLGLSAGADSTCGANELCSRSSVPLNTDPLAGLDTPGGPDVSLAFVATASSPDSLQPFTAEPLADLNGDGDLTGTEQLNDDNRVAMEVTNWGGIVTDASLNGPDCVATRAGTQVCTALSASLPVVVGALLAHCPIDGTGAATSNGGPCMEVRVLPNAIFNSALSMNTTSLYFLPINDLSTHGLVMRIREPGGPALGYIMKEAGDTYPQFVVHQTVYMDAPNLSILGGVVSHDLTSKPLQMTLKGPVTYLADGRMHVAMKNLADIPLSVNIKTLGLSGNIDLLIPKGELHLTVVGPALR